jgi:hypothetical protein
MQRIPAEVQCDATVATQLATLPRVVVGEEREALVGDVLEQHRTSRRLVFDAGRDHHGGRLGQHPAFLGKKRIGQPGVEEYEGIGRRVGFQQVIARVIQALIVKIWHAIQSGTEVLRVVRIQLSYRSTGF